MATVSDASFGAGFDADLFRTAITNTMTMGLPNTVSERITFQWTVVDEFTTEDNSGYAYEWDETPTTTDAPSDVLVPAAVEFITRSTLGGGTAIAEFDTPRVRITLLDTDFPSITSDSGRLADRMMIGGNLYMVDFVEPPTGLFDVTIYMVHGSAVDET